MQVDRVFTNLNESYLCYHVVERKQIKMLQQDQSFVTDDIKVYTEIGYSVIVGEAEAVRERIAILEKSLPTWKELPVVEKKFKLVEEEFRREMSAQYPEVKIHIGNNMIILEGPDREVQAGATKVDELMKKVLEKRVKLPEHLISFIKTSSTISKYQNRFQQSLRNPVSLEVGSDLVLSSLSSGALDEASAAVERDLSVDTVKLEGAAAVPPDLDRVKDILNKAKNEANCQEFRVDVSFIPGASGTAETKVRLVGYTENVNKLKEVLHDYQMNQVGIQEVLNLPHPELVQCFDKIIDLIGMKQTKVTIKTSPFPYPCVLVSGPRCLVNKVQTDLNATLASLTLEMLVLDGPGVQWYFQRKGKESKQEVNVLVAPMINKKLTSTKIGKCLKEVGSAMEKNFDQMAKKWSLSSDYVMQVDAPPSLGCSKIFFIECLPWDGVRGKSKQALRNGLKRCLDLCVQQGWSSVALPVIGPGVALKYPLREAIEVLTENIHQFGLSASSGSLSTIHVVIKPGYPDSEESYHDVYRHLSLNMNQGGQAIFRPLTSDLDDVTIMLGGGVKLQLVFGDITNETTDAIVNTTDFVNIQNDGVCKDILTVAGPQVEAQLKNAKVNRGEVFKTQPGSFPCKAILHVCGEKDTGVIKQLVCRIIQLCESSGYKSVAIPAICAGTGGLDPVQVAHAILRGANTTTSSSPIQCLTEIRLVLIKIDVFLAFKKQAIHMFPRAVINTASVPQVTHATQHPPPLVMNVDLSVLRTTSTIQQCHFLIVGLCRKDVENAMAKLKDLYQDQCCTQTLKKEDLAGFTQDKINSLKQLMEILGLYVEEDQSSQGREVQSGAKKPDELVKKVLEKRVKLPTDLLSFIRSSGAISKYQAHFQRSLRNPVSLEALTSALASLTSQTLVLDGPGGQRYFRTEGKVSKELVESSWNVLIREQQGAYYPDVKTKSPSFSSPIPSIKPGPSFTTWCSNPVGSTAVNKTSLEIKLGSLEDEQVNVLVVPMIKRQLTFTKIGQCLLSKAGNRIKVHFALMASKCPPRPGDVLQIDGPPSLGCSKIFFIECLPWDGVRGKSVEALNNGLKRCLELCVQQGLSSVAFPVIGPGIILKYPLREAIEVLTENIRQFGLSASSGSLSTIHVVIKPGYPDSEECYHDVYRHLSMNMNQRGQAIFRSLTTDLDDITITVGGGIKLQVVFGDITNETTDAVVNTTDFVHFQRDGVCKDILTKAGPQVEAILKSTKVKQGAVVRTPPGLFPCEAILHVCGKKNAGIIEQLVCRIIQDCETFGYKSVAIPAICAGAGGLDCNVVAHAILRGIKTATSSTPLYCLSNIRLVLIKIKVFLAFKHQMMQMSESILQLPHVPQQESPVSINADQSIVCTSSENQQQRSTFMFLGLCKKNVDNAMTKLRNLYETQCSTETFTKEDLEGLTQDDMNNVKQLVESLDLNMEEDQFELDGLTVTGLKDRVNQVMQMIHTIGPLRRETRAREEEDLYTRVAWCILGPNGNWERLPRTANHNLESCDVMGGIADAKGILWSVDLQRMEAQRHGQKAKLKRLENLPDFTLPLYWDNMAAGEGIKVVELQPSSAEYQTVKEAFKRTATAKTIIKIERLQNVHLRRAYEVQKKYIADKNGQGGAGEKLLYHGTTQDNCDSIMKTGFNRSFAGKNASFGQGSYFAVDANYSAHTTYSRPAVDGSQLMFVARVLTGIYTWGFKGMKVPPPRNNQQPHNRYDSVVDKLDNPGMYVVFHDNQAYPDYLITFK
ncbi:poly [ADP-ribose] [Lates japonicus]|uniref:Poly [ADP-ribose] polymerase n=1 Tax=Lates japonicus TaxID=270547 RepID=A0AAD3MFP8_LATJO|nr:poly [ADP-ribose] [Lates japonicus]